MTAEGDLQEAGATGGFFVRGLREVRATFVEAVVEWFEDGVMERGAALAYYVLLSLGPLLAILVGALQLVVADDSVRPAVLEAVGRFAGGRAAETASTVISRAEPPELLSPASLLTLAVLLFGATAVFANVRGSLNAMWGIEGEAESYTEHVRAFLRTRWRGFVMMCLTGLLLVLSFLVTSITSLVSRFLSESAVPFGSTLVQGLDFAVSIVGIGVLFGAVFRTLPEVRVEWSSVWIGAFGTAGLFVVGKVLVAQIIARAEWTSYYGPGASVVAFLAWVYFSAQIFFFGAEFTQVWSRRHGGVLDPDKPGSPPLASGASGDSA